MKRSFLLIVCSFTAMILLAQAPEAINYQAVLRGSNNSILANQDVNLRISVLAGNINGTEAYKETHSTSTNQYGIVNLAIGTGTVILGTFDSIDWGGSYHYIKVEADTTDGTNYYEMGTSQLLSVPYALESKHASSLTLTGEDGNKYEIKVDSSGNLEVVPFVEWGQPCPGIPTVNYEGQTYNTVQIGEQCWFKENLNVGTMIVSNAGGGGHLMEDNDTIEKYCINNDNTYCDMYGGLYEWTEAMQYVETEGEQGICPSGWHIPTDGEWIVLLNYLGGVEIAGGKMKEIGFTHWNSPNTGATNSSGFTGLPGGARDGTFGYFYAPGDYGGFWSSTIKEGTDFVWDWSLRNFDTYVNHVADGKAGGISVRCLKDENGMTGQPCPGIPTVNYEGQTYNTVQIGSQCWLKENLNVGTKINSTSGGFLQTDNDLIEKYCYNNDEANCDIYGGLYEWPEAMQYVTTEGVQGICPDGWHIPTNGEWKILEGTVDSQYPVGDPEWVQEEWRGLDAGGNLKEEGTTHWNSPNTGATNSSGFTGLPGGYRGPIDGGFGSLWIDNDFWTSSQYNAYAAWYRALNYNNTYVFLGASYKDYALSVRCIKNN